MIQKLVHFIKVRFETICVTDTNNSTELHQDTHSHRHDVPEPLKHVFHRTEDAPITPILPPYQSPIASSTSTHDEIDWSHVVESGGTELTVTPQLDGRAIFPPTPQPGDHGHHIAELPYSPVSPSGSDMRMR